MPDGHAGASGRRRCCGSSSTSTGRWSSARLHATAQGLYEAFLNGERVGDAELTPGFTQYDARLQVQTFDVTASLSRRAATRSASSWPTAGSAARSASPGRPTSGGPELALLAQLHLVHDDGAVTVVGTGPGWRSSRRARRRRRPDRGRAVGPHPAAARLGRARLRRRGLGRRRRRRARLRRPGRLAGAAGAPGRGDRPACRSPGSTTGAQIVDLGQNINGWVRLTNLGPAGTTITLTHGEWLGARRRRHDREPASRTCRSCRSRCRPARSTRWSPPVSRATSSSRAGRRTASSTSASRATPAS